MRIAENVGDALAFWIGTLLKHKAHHFTHGEMQEHGEHY